MGTPLYNTDIIPMTSRPTLTVMDDGDYFVILDTSTGKISKILKTNIMTALNISYDNISGLTAETVQAALDELDGHISQNESDIGDLQNDKLDKIPEAGASIGTAQNPYSEGHFENVVVNNEIDTEFIKTGTIEASKHFYGVAVTASVTFTKASNTISLAGITADLGLELGDVIHVSGTTSNDNLYTVETASANSIVVNYEHRNDAGSLSLTDETKACTIRRIAKWYNAPLGLGQKWVDLTAQRAKDTTYTNTTGRAIYVAISCILTNALTHGVFVDGITVARQSQTAVAEGWNFEFVVPEGSIYKLGATTLPIWMELR